MALKKGAPLVTHDDDRKVFIRLRKQLRKGLPSGQFKECLLFYLENTYWPEQWVRIRKPVVYGNGCFN